MSNDFAWWPACTLRGADQWPDTWGPDPGPMPAEVPNLSAANIRQDGQLGDGDCRCLLGWAAGFPVDQQTRVDQAIQAVIQRRGWDGEIDAFSDFEDPQVVADVWNEAMGVELGYDEAFSD